MVNNEVTISIGEAAIERWFDGINIPKCMAAPRKLSNLAVSSTVSACGVDKPDSSYTIATLNQEVNNYLCPDFVRFR
jgi:hypothetical protein